MGRNDTYFPSNRFSSQMKAKGKGHVSFPNRRLFRPALALQTDSARPRLTLAVPATVTLPASLLVHHRVAPALRAQVARHTQVAQTQCACGRGSGGGWIAGTIHCILLV